MYAKRLVSVEFAAGLVAVLGTFSLAAAREIPSPGFTAAWAQLRQDGRLFYHCLADLRNNDAAEIDLVVQFRRADVNDANILERGSDRALLLFPQTWRRPADKSADAMPWEPDPVELAPALFERADLAPGEHDIDAIFDLYDVKARKYIAGGWPWRLTLRVTISADGKAALRPYRPGDMFPLFHDPKEGALPPVVLESAQIAGKEPLPAELAGYGLTPLRVFGTTRLRHGAELKEVRLTKDGGTIVSVGRDGVVRFWSAERGALVGQSKGTLLEADDGSLLVFSTEPAPAVLDPAGDRKPLAIEDAPKEVLAAGLLSGPRRLVLLGESSVGQWDLASGKRTAQRSVSLENRPPQAKLTGSISPCGRFAALAYNSGKMNSVTVFETTTGRRVLSTVMDYGVAPPVRVCGGGKLLALPEPQRSGRYSLAIFDAATGQKLRELDTGYRGTPLAVSPDGATVAATENETLLLHDPVAGQSRQLPNLADSAQHLLFSPDGALMAIAGYKGLVVLDVKSGKPLLRQGDGVRVVAFSADGKRLVAGRDGGEIVVCELPGGAEVLRAAELSLPVCGLAASADGRRLAACSEEGQCRVWNYASGLPIFAAFAHQTTDANPAHVALSPDGARLVTSATGGSDPLVWDIEKGRVMTPLAVGGIGAGAVVFSRDGRCVAACHHAGEQSALCVWDLSTREPVLRDPCQPRDAAFTADGKALVVARQDPNSIRLFDWTDRRPGATIDLPEAPESLAFSPDGKRIAVASVILDAKSGRVVAEHEKLDDPEARYLFTPDGKHLLAVADGKLHVFEASTGKRARTIEGPWPITAALFGVDGKTLLTGLSSGAVVAWEWKL